jgi:hypothetical protein
MIKTGGHTALKNLAQQLESHLQTDLNSDTLSDRISENQQSLAIAYSIKRSHSFNSSSTATFLGSQNGELEGSVGASNATRLTSAIAKFVYCKGLSFLATEGDQFLQILKLACMVNSTYRPPNRNFLSNELLDVSYKNRLSSYMTALETALDVDADVYGLLLFGDGATVHGMPLMNILGNGIGEPSAILAIVNLSDLLLLFVLLPNLTLTHFVPTCCSIYLRQVQTILFWGEKVDCRIHCVFV